VFVRPWKTDRSLLIETAACCIGGSGHTLVFRSARGTRARATQLQAREFRRRTFAEQQQCCCFVALLSELRSQRLLRVTCLRHRLAQATTALCPFWIWYSVKSGTHYTDTDRHCKASCSMPNAWPIRRRVGQFWHRTSRHASGFKALHMPDRPWTLVGMAAGRRCTWYFVWSITTWNKLRRSILRSTLG